jgi:hypothetical protein
VSRWKFTPNVELIDDDGDSRGLYRREGTGAHRVYTDEPAWHGQERPVFQREVEAWGWTVRDLSIEQLERIAAEPTP